MKPVFDAQIRIAEMSAGAPFFATAWTILGRHPYAHRDYVTAFAIVEGEGRFFVRQADGTFESSAMKPGEMYLLRPRDAYFYEGVGEKGMSGYVVSSTLAYWNAFSNLIGLETSWLAAHTPPRVLFDIEDPRVVDPFERAVERFRTDPSMLDLLEFWVAMAPIFLRPDRERAREGAPRWLIPSIEAMKSESNLALGLPRLLDLTRVAPSHLSRTVRRYFGMTPTELVLDMRIQHAATLINTTSDSISSIAFRCGFADASYFGLCFRRATLVSPREYRRQHLGGLAASIGAAETRSWPRVDKDIYYVTTYLEKPHRKAVRAALRWGDESDETDDEALKKKNDATKKKKA